MASSAQIAANQANAQHSTGPKTCQGKATSKLNAMKHGMTSSLIVLPNEDAAEWESFRAMIIESFRPHGEDEQILAVSIAEHRWRIRRLNRIETALLESRMKAVSEADPNIQGYDALAQLFIDPAEQKRLSLLLRYMSSAERAHRKAMDELRVLQMARQEAAMMERMAERRAAAAAKQPQRQFGAELRNEAKLPPPIFSFDPAELALRL